MLLKLFDFRVYLYEPYTRKISVTTRAYEVEGGCLHKLECKSRQFDVTDAIDFDLEFGSMIQLTYADVVFGTRDEPFDCTVSECAIKGVTVLKVYEVLIDDFRGKLFSVMQMAQPYPSRIYADSAENLAPQKERVRKVSQLIGVPEKLVELA
ncbi:MAG: hypothetical protein RMI04_06890 [Thermofilaceae archaeon]|nr:hypothetical protein [Thermofilaceae archaeon]